MRAIEIILHDLADAVIDGKAQRSEKAEEGPRPARRSSRAAFRADEAEKPDAVAAPAATVTEPEPAPAVESTPAAPQV